MELLWFVIGLAFGLVGVPAIEYNTAPEAYTACQQMLDDAWDKKYGPRNKDGRRLGLNTAEPTQTACEAAPQQGHDQALAPPTPRMPSAP